MHLYVKEDNNGRSVILALSSDEVRGGLPDRALVFRAVPGNATQAMVEFLKKEDVDLSGSTKLTPRKVRGCLGLINIADEIFLAVVLNASVIGNMRPSATSPETALRIDEVGFFSLSSSTWDLSPAHLDSGSTTPDGLPLSDDSTGRDTYGPNYQTTNVLEHPCAPLIKILSSGTFYCAQEGHWDISSRMSLNKNVEKEFVDYDERFVWNEYIVGCMLDLRDKLDPLERSEMDAARFIILAIQGFIGVFTVALPAPPTNGTPVIATISLISRLGWKRAGTRFNTRGIDDDGNTANFVETETIFSTDESCFSYVQIRGSVPLFWEQQGLQTFGQRIQITRPHASQPAFEKHFANLIEEYGTVHAINLLSGTKENEAILATAYRQQLQIARAAFGDSIGMTHLDFHHVVRVGGHESVVRELKAQKGIRENIDRFGYTHYDPSLGVFVIGQTGVFRTNCLDCLDRTNFVQDLMSRMSLEQHLGVTHREWVFANALWSNHRELWAENGDALSRIYAGTGALNTSYTRSGKRTLAGVLSDATKSVSRAYINNFQDKHKQLAIDMFLGNLSSQRPVQIYDPIHNAIQSAMKDRLAEYSTTMPIKLFVGTWNLNGRPPTESLVPWLFPIPGIIDMFVLGFQEIVPLTAQQIVQADPEKRRIWEAAIMDTIQKQTGNSGKFVLLRSEQLVGTALFVIVRSSMLSSIRNVEGTTKKTGLRGMSGNKGGVGIRLEFHDTTFCFITAHLAAGHSNVDERNADYRTISGGLQFLKGKTIDSHDIVIWLADANYRIALDNDIVRSLIDGGDLDTLVGADQLKTAMDQKAVFNGYGEGPLLFRPTYRYDVNSDDYDTSEKMRIPAWTDRILYRGSSLQSQIYSRAELKGSDHRPVFAIFRGEVRIIDTEKRSALRQYLFDSITHTDPGEKLDDKLAALTLPLLPVDLPPPSSDTSAWWDDPEHPGGIYVPLGHGQGQHGPNNPFDSPAESPLSSPSSSDEELYTHAFSLPTPITPTPVPRKPPPPPPPPRSAKPLNAPGMQS